VSEGTSPDGALVFATDTNTGTPTERMRITSTGNVEIDNFTGFGVAPSTSYKIYSLSSESAAYLRTTSSSSSVYALRVRTGADSVTVGVMGNGRVGIGTAFPSQKLDVVGKIRATDDLILAQANPKISYDNGTTGALRFASNNGAVERMRITSGGNLLIGTDSDNGNRLRVNGTIFSNSSVTASNFITTSDRRLKSEIKEIKNAISILSKFASYEYVKDGKQDAGFIAQEVKEAIPYSVFENNGDMLTMSDRPILAYIHKAILELNERINKLEK
jgi:hypothetical protein